MQGSLNKDTLGIKVAAMGVPTVIDTATIVNDTIDMMQDKLKKEAPDMDEALGILSNIETNEKLMFIKEVLSPKYGDTYVTPNEIDELIETLSDILAMAINIAVHPGFEENDM